MEEKTCYICQNSEIKEDDKFCKICGFNLTPPKVLYDHRATVKKLLNVLVEEEVLVDQVDRVLAQLREAVMTSTRVQQIWASESYNDNGYKDLPLK